jgi:hypothetical protein
MLVSFMAISEQAECPYPVNSTMNKCGNGCEPNCEDLVDKGTWCPNSLCPGPACACDQVSQYFDDKKISYWIILLLVHIS